MNAPLKSRIDLSTLSNVNFSESSKLSVKVELEHVFQNLTSKDVDFGEFYSCGKDLNPAAAYSLSYNLPPHNGSTR